MTAPHWLSTDNLLDALQRPDWLVQSAWLEHIPFGMYVVARTKPRLLVELGTHYGASYCAFCESVRVNQLDTRCFAIDTWEGDEHAGFYGNEVYETLHTYHEERFGQFSTLKRSTFQDSLPYFADNSIDLLHIDGYHTYEETRNNFDNWLPKMSNRGLVLLHDTNVRRNTFGVWQVWQELTDEYPHHFEFVHGYGLGILSTGRNIPPGIAHLFDQPAIHQRSIRYFFMYTGQRWLQAYQQQQTHELLTRLKNKTGQTNREFKELQKTHQQTVEQQEQTRHVLKQQHQTDIQQLKQQHQADIQQLKHQHQIQQAELEEQLHRLQQTYHNLQIVHTGYRSQAERQLNHLQTTSQEQVQQLQTQNNDLQQKFDALTEHIEHLRHQHRQHLHAQQQARHTKYQHQLKDFQEQITRQTAQQLTDIEALLDEELNYLTRHIMQTRAAATPDITSHQVIDHTRHRLKTLEHTVYRELNQLASLAEDRQQALQARLDHVQTRLQQSNHHLTQSHQALQYLKTRFSQRFMHEWWRWRTRLAPPGSRRENLYYLLRMSIFILLSQGFSAFVYRTWRWLRGERFYFRQVAPASTHTPPDDSTQPAAHTSKDNHHHTHQKSTNPEPDTIPVSSLLPDDLYHKPIQTVLNWGLSLELQVDRPRHDCICSPL